MSCPDCFSGHVHAGTPTGKTTKLHGLDVYVAEPTESSTPPKGIIIIIPDAFGWEFVNNRILADHYADRGGTSSRCMDTRYNAPPLQNIISLRLAPQTVYPSPPPPPLPAYKSTNPNPLSYHLVCAVYSMLPFIISNRFSTSYPIVLSFFTAVRDNEGVHLPVGAAGFCWGGKHTLNLAFEGVTSAKNGKPLIDAGFTGHPSNLEIPGEIEKIEKPVSFAIGDKDIAVSMAQVEQIRKVVEEKGAGEVKVYYGTGHGFCVRADHIREDSRKQAEEAEEQAIAWFKRHFEGVEH
ncbi:hypothetical protein MMC14_006263 [Varicellaria rhodocarpa]|nr:hypothetical protein [Varicellaria rhodocarpa]